MKEHVMEKNNAVETVVVNNENQQEDNNVSTSSESTGNKGQKAKLTRAEKQKKTINTIINVVLVIALVFAAICTYISFVAADGKSVPSFFGIKILSVQTDSMKDTIMPGDLIVDTEVTDASTLQVNDIVTYWTIIEGQRVLNTHRIVNIYDGGNFRIFETQGDNSTIADALTVHENEIEGKYLFRIPGVGKAVDYMQTPVGFFLVVVLPVLIFFIYHLIQFFRVLFEYQNVKMLIKYEQERGANEDIIAAAVQDEQQQAEIRRAAYEAELREKLRAELLADIEKEKAAQGKESDSEE
jgi:signal peptidase